MIKVNFSQFYSTLPPLQSVRLLLCLFTSTVLFVAYILALLSINGLAFILVSCCYVSIFTQVRGSNAAMVSDTIDLAKRMAVLVATDFICWGPVALVAGLSAGQLVPHSILPLSTDHSPAHLSSLSPLLNAPSDSHFSCLLSDSMLHNSALSPFSLSYPSPHISLLPISLLSPPVSVSPLCVSPLYFSTGHVVSEVLLTMTVVLKLRYLSIGRRS